MNVIEKLFLVGALCALSGCVTLTNVSPQADLHLAPDEGLVMIGVPHGTQLIFHSGDVDGNEYISNEWTLPSGIAGSPTDGYLIRKLKALPEGQVYGLAQVGAGRWYLPSCGDKIPVFNVKPGKVQYLGHFDFIVSGNSMKHRFRPDMAAAQAHMTKNYPKVNQALVGIEASWLTQRRCRTQVPVIIPIYVGR